ncbi:MAG: cytochrome d ubiquinol oxidase subunit II [Alteromonadaceae bacterium]|nr:cytochrome d ubiquinol oxidase subunit II [Alteromonadaceae bacterium]
MIDYETLRVIWWALVGVLLIGFVITDGFDLGVGALLTIIGRTDRERRIMINTVGPHWDGNQVWFITAGGALFAAFPMIYATAFSGFYIALFLVLAALWMRPIGFDYRGKFAQESTRNMFDWMLFAGGVMPSLVFGVAFGNLLLGVPFTLDETLKATYTGTFWQLLNPFAILVGLISLGMLLTHGAAWLQLKTDGFIRARAQKTAFYLGMVTVALFIIAGVCVAWFIEGYVVTSELATDGQSNPLLKTVGTEIGAWMNNYGHYPLFALAPIMAIVSGLSCSLFSALGHAGKAFVASALHMTGIILTAGFSMFPFLLPSSVQPAASLTMWDATASELTLKIMFFVACVFVPIVLGYTAYCFYVMRGRITDSDLDKSHAIY